MMPRKRSRFRGEWMLWGDSIRGPGHVKNGLPNQDHFAARNFLWGEVVVVSDGLGSKPLSDIGSLAACCAVIGAAKCLVGAPTRQSKITDLLSDIHRRWLERIWPRSARDCAATCLFVIRRGGFVTAARLGDGMLALCRRLAAPLVMTDDKGESFSNVSECLSKSFNASVWETRVMPESEITAAVLCTDGIADDLRQGTHGRFAESLRNEYAHLLPSEIASDVRRWLTNWSVPGATDDRTVACLQRRGVR